MNGTLSTQATNWREGRRLRAWEPKQKSWKQKDIAEALGVSDGAVSQWVKLAKEGGVDALRHRKPTGADDIHRRAHEYRSSTTKLRLFYPD